MQAGSVSGTAAAASIAPGLLITAILVVNNLRDIETDARAGKRTLAVRLGVRGSLAEYVLLLGVPFLIPPVFLAAGVRGPLILLPLLSLPLALPLAEDARRATRGRPGDERRTGRHRAPGARLLPSPGRRPRLLTGRSARTRPRGGGLRPSIVRGVVTGSRPHRSARVAYKTWMTRFEQACPFLAFSNLLEFSP